MKLIPLAALLFVDACFAAPPKLPQAAPLSGVDANLYLADQSKDIALLPATPSDTIAIAGDCLKVTPTMQLRKIKCPADSAHSWHLMTITYGGKVSLVSHLTHREAEFMYNRIEGLPATDAEKRAAAQAAATANAAWDKAHPKCPKVGTSSARWDAWYKAHPNDSKCITWGVNFTSISNSAISDGDIKTAEVFQ
jgi:hypothetical protein